MKRLGFTLIELLIVVAIIAILAAIAVPNFLEAQTRAKVSRVKADMRSISVALNAYAVDHSKFPPAKLAKDPSFYNNLLSLILISNGARLGAKTTFLTTPVAYITGFPDDPFSIYHPVGYVENSYSYTNIQGILRDDSWSGASSAQCKQIIRAAGGALRFDGPGSLAIPTNFVLSSAGPTKWALTIQNLTYQAPFATLFVEGVGSASVAHNYNSYDPTNGTTSAGCIYQVN